MDNSSSKKTIIEDSYYHLTHDNAMREIVTPKRDKYANLEVML